MIIYEFKVKGKSIQYQSIDEAILTAQFVRNKCLRYWIDNENVNRAELYRYNTYLRADFPFVEALNSHACQASVERAWSSIARFYDNCNKQVPGKKGYPSFKHNSRSVEYKTSGWKLDETRRHITFTDGKKIGKLKLVGTRELNFYQLKQIKRVRLVKRADGYYCQFAIAVDVTSEVEPSSSALGLDVGLNFFYTDSLGRQEENPRFYRKAEVQLKRLQRRVSKKFKKPKKKGDRQSNNYKKAKQKLARKHLKVSRQRQEHAKRLARCVCKSNDLIAYEDLKVRNMVRNQKLAKSINDAGWYQFRVWLEYYGLKFEKVTVAVPPHQTSQKCSNCGNLVKKSLSTRTHVCRCGCLLDRDQNAAINILKIGLSTVGHTGTWALDAQKAGGDETSTGVGANLLQQVLS